MHQRSTSEKSNKAFSCIFGLILTMVAVVLFILTEALSFLGSLFLVIMGCAYIVYYLKSADEEA